jgi:membrane fusion protein, multidrug efflux system
MKRSLLIITLLVVVGAFAGFQQYSSWSLNRSQNNSVEKPQAGAEQSSTRPGRADGQAPGGAPGGRSREAVPVLVATAIQKSVPVQLRAVGNVEPYTTVAIKSQVTGVLMQAHFKEGQDVKNGQQLFTVDPRPFEAALRQAEANMQRDNAQLKNLREQVRRYAELVEKQYVSREQYDLIKTNADAAEAVVEADKAAVENAKVQLSYCYIYSPVNGRVGSLLVNEGNLVRVNDAAPLVVINQVNPINVTFSVPEQHLGDLKRHMSSGTLSVDASFQSDDGRPEQGKLEFVDNAVDRSTGTIKLKAVFANTERRLWPGQFVNVALTLTTEPNAVVVPSEAVQVGPEGQHVFVVQPDKRVEVRPVTLGTTSGGEAVIRKGLAAGEQIVREGQFLLGPGSRIEIKDTAVSDLKDQKNDQKEQKRERAGKGKGKAQEGGQS